MKVITKFSDYELHTIEFFIKRLKDEFLLRDIPGLTNDRIKIMPVSKEHPLVLLMQKQLANNQETIASISSQIIPCIGVTPGNPTEIGTVMGLSPSIRAIDEDWINEYESIKATLMQERIQEGLVTDKQIATIKKAFEEGEELFCSLHKYRQQEEANISLWTESADVDIVLSNMVESILTDIQSGFLGDQSKIKNMKVSQVKGLTNFNFGRVLYGTEFVVTFMNTRNNYTVYSEDRFSEVRVDISTRISGDSYEEQ